MNIFLVYFMQRFVHNKVLTVHWLLVEKFIVYLNKYKKLIHEITSILLNT